MIYLDFHPGRYGHFLEYVANVYIMQTTPGKSDLFTPLGTSHNADSEYHDHRLIFARHWSYYGRDQMWINDLIKKNDQVIRINAEADNDNHFFILLTNWTTRVRDEGFDSYINNIPTEITSNRKLHRIFWYSKMDERHLHPEFEKTFGGMVPYKDFSSNVFEFPLEAFFSFADFVENLAKLSCFLNQTFFPDASLYELWKRFDEKNHGKISLLKVNNLLENIVGNQNMPINCTILEEAMLNYKLGKICKLFDGEITQTHYPKNTKIISNELQNYLQSIR